MIAGAGGARGGAREGVRCAGLTRVEEVETGE
jgi:hypothetical protein